MDRLGETPQRILAAIIWGTACVAFLSLSALLMAVTAATIKGILW